MEDNPAPGVRPLMDTTIFKENFGVTPERKTYLCYEVEVWAGDTWTPVEELKGFLRNQGADTPGQPRRHAELCLLDRVQSWPLDREKQYRLTWYISWSPCPDCVPELVAFLRGNGHVSLRIFAAQIHSLHPGYERGLRNLRDAGAELAIMTLEEHQHCWETFVDNQGQWFQAWPKLRSYIKARTQFLKNILGNREN